MTTNYMIARMAAAVALTLLVPAAVHAFSATSPSYRLDSAAINSFGGDAASTEYKLTSSGGEPFIGAGAGTTYKFNAGYVASLDHSISLTLDALQVTIPSVAPGTSQTATSTVTVRTDAAGYYLSARQDHDLLAENGTTTIAAVSGTIASPAVWSEGSTKGFGFTLTSGSGLDVKWGSNPNYNYAAFPTTNTIIHAKPNYTNGDDGTVVQYRLDTVANQLAAKYRNYVTYNATVKP